MNKVNKKVALAIGSNLGNRLEMLRGGIRELEHRGFTILKMSRVWETLPWGETEQPRFLNMCVLAESKLEPKDMLNVLKAIERSLGRKETKRWGPRLIDIDIVMIDSDVIDTPDLQVPHPCMQKRAFVLAPLSEIAPDMVNLRIGKTVEELLLSLPKEKMDWIINA